MFVARTCDLPLSDYPDDFPTALRRVLSARRIAYEDLKKSLGQLVHDSKLTNADKAAARLAQAIEACERIVIVGDYDADGATATALMVLFLRRIGAEVLFTIPNRQQHGYGLSAHFLQEAVLPLAPNLIFTVDNGIRSHDAVAIAKAAGIDVIITDHHLPSIEEMGEVLPKADVIVNPNVTPISLELSHLSGVGVAFYVLLSLRRLLAEQCPSRVKNLNMGDMLDLVAIGTMADCVTLDYNNRILVAAGVARIRAGRASLGVNALITAIQKTPANLSATDIAFYLAPILNAAGRLDDMRLGVDCLLATSVRMANDYALHLIDLNRQRKMLENQSHIDAERILRTICEREKFTQSICVYDASWHEGVIGIVASRLADIYYRPTVVFTKGSGAHAGLLKGSARGVAGINLVETFAELAAELPNVIVHFGGHAKAAGIGIYEKELKTFKRAFHKKTERVIAEKIVSHDGELLGDELSLGFANTLKEIEVWGTDNPEPIFVNTFDIRSVRLVGDNHAKCQLFEPQQQVMLEAMAFSQYEVWREMIGTQRRVAYRLDINEWRGTKRLQLIIESVDTVSEQVENQRQAMWA